MSEQTEISLKALCESLGVNSLPSFFSDIYEKKLCEGTLFDTFRLTNEYILSQHKKYCLFDESLIPLILKSAAAIRERGELITYINLLTDSYSDPSNFFERLSEFSGPDVGGADDTIDFLYLFALLPLIDIQDAELTRHNMPQEIKSLSFREYNDKIFVDALQYGRPVCAKGHFGWLLRFCHATIIRIEELSFEIKRGTRLSFSAYRNKLDGSVCVFYNNVRIHKSGMVLGSSLYDDGNGSFTATFDESDTEITGYPIDEKCLCSDTPITLSKTIWELVIKSGDDYINVHIPRGAKIDSVNSKKSFDSARIIFDELYDDFHPKSFICFSWLLDPALGTILKPDSNILGFQKEFSRFPYQSAGREVFSFVFPAPFKDYSELPEKTSLQRSIKQKYLKGEKIYGFGGVKPF